MTIIDFMRKKLTEYPKIAEFLTDEVHVDFTEPGTKNYGLSSSGEILVKEDLLGNQTRRHNFVLYAVSPSFTDYNRLANSNFLLNLGQWLEGLPEEDGIQAKMDGRKGNGRFLKASCANAMAMSQMGETMADGILYQLQISATYRIESEEF